MERVILHSDMNSFYASVECLCRPEIRNSPVAVCGDIEQRHGIILAKNGIAKKYGVATGEAIWQAKQKCPSLVTVEARYDLYMQVSRAARQIYQRYTDRVESFGLDESWLDLTGFDASPAYGLRVAQELRNIIHRELGVTVSVGVSWNKIFAKLGSDLKKPNAVTVISKENFKGKIWPLPACDLLYVGPATTRKLARYGIRTIGELAGAGPDFLRGMLGKWGETLWAFANGYDVSPVTHADFTAAIKSIGNSMTTWRDIENADEAWKVFTVLSESVGCRLRENGFHSKTVQISIRDINLDWQERQGKLRTPSCSAYEIAKRSMELFNENWDFHLPLRSLGVRACDLSTEGNCQLSFLEDAAHHERRERLESSVDVIRRRFGFQAVRRAVLLGDDIVRESDPLTHEVHPVFFNF